MEFLTQAPLWVQIFFSLITLLLLPASGWLAANVWPIWKDRNALRNAAELKHQELLFTSKLEAEKAQLQAELDAEKRRSEREDEDRKWQRQQQESLMGTVKDLSEGVHKLSQNNAITVETLKEVAQSVRAQQTTLSIMVGLVPNRKDIQEPIDRVNEQLSRINATLARLDSEAFGRRVTDSKQQ